MLNITTTRIRQLYNISRFMTISRMMTNICSFVYVLRMCICCIFNYIYNIILYIIIYIHILYISLSNGDVSIYSRVFLILIATSSFMTNTRPTRQHMPSSACRASKKSCVSFGCNAFCASGITWKFTSKQLRSSGC